jgi:AcrR family transcriptional regulator
LRLRKPAAKSSRSRAKPRERTRLENDARRAQLLELAQEAFATRSYDEVSIDDLARAAGVSKGLLYHYFPTKRDLYVAGLREAAKDLMARTMIEKREGVTPIERMRAGLDAYLEYAMQHAPSYSALLRGGIGSDPEIAAVIEATRVAYVERMLADAEGVPLPKPAKQTPLLRLALRGWIGFVEHTSLDWIARPDAVSQRQLRDLLVDALLTTVKLAVGSPLTRDW